MATYDQFQASLSALLNAQNESNRQTLHEAMDMQQQAIQAMQAHSSAQVNALQQQFTQAQVAAHQSVIDGLRSLEEKRAGATLLKLSPLIDVKTIQSMSKFSGKDEDWQSWKFSTLGVFAILGMRNEIELSCELDDNELFLGVLDEKLRPISEALWHLLTVVLQGRASVVIKRVAEKHNGFFAWKALLREYEPKQAGHGKKLPYIRRVRNMMIPILVGERHPG